MNYCWVIHNELPALQSVSQIIKINFKFPNLNLNFYKVSSSNDFCFATKVNIYEDSKFDVKIRCYYWNIQSLWEFKKFDDPLSRVYA